MEKERNSENLGKLSDVGLFIENYDYIFSDFDSRSYSQKLLSEDLLNEMNRASKEKKFGDIDLKFLVPKNKRDFRKEKIIKERLKEQFKINLKNLELTLLTFLSVLSEPAGWFLFWEGLNLIIFQSKKKVPELDFYKKMSKAKIIFVDFD